MDDQPRTDLLILWKRLLPATGMLALVAGSIALVGCPSDQAVTPVDLPAVGGQVSLIRVPHERGPIEAYSPDSLDEPIWTSRSDLPRIREAVGVNPESRHLFVIDTAKNLLAVDLESRGVRHLAQGIESAVMAGDGSVFAVNRSGRITRYQGGLPTPYRTELPVQPVFQTGTLGDAYIAVLGTDPKRLLILSADRQLGAAEIGGSHATATYWADLVAVADRNRVTLYRTEDPFDSQTFETDGDVREVAFSPSGHRLYVAHADSRIDVIDRYSLDRLTTIALPGAPRALRVDGSGRWLLAQPESGDSAWVIDVATNSRVATIESEWSHDLPTVAGAATLLTRLDDDLIASDLSRASRPELGRIPGGGEDEWMVTTWLPRDRMTLAEAAAESVLVQQDSLLIVDSQTVAPTDRLFLQVSSSRNAEWTRELARNLTAAGYPTRVLDPAGDEEGYRVVIGPFPTREEAEETGRKLGRPYFVLTNPPIKQ